MALERKTSVAVGLATMGLVWGVYGQVLPRVADLRAGDAHNDQAASAEKAARWTSGGLVVGVSLITKDPTVFIMGAVAVIAFSWLHRHANAIDPQLGTTVIPSSRAMMHDMVPAAGYTAGA